MASCSSITVISTSSGAVPEADLVCAGSVLDALPQTGFQGIVAGAGKLKGSTHTDLYHATVLGLRAH